LIYEHLTPPRLKDRGSSWRLSPTENPRQRKKAWLAHQTVVGKGIPNPLITEGLLKILKDLIPLSFPKSLTNSHPSNGKTSKEVVTVSPAK